MRLRRVRFTIRRLMVAIFLGALLFRVVVIYREQLQRGPELQGLKNSYENAKLTREVAEIGVEEYDESSYKDAEDAAGAEITIADRVRAEDRLVWSNKTLKNGYTVLCPIPFEPHSPQTFFTEETENEYRQKILSKYTCHKTLESLKAEVKDALADEQSKKTAYDRMKASMIGPFWKS